MSEPVLSVEKLSVGFDEAVGTLQVLDRVSFEVNRGQCVALVGESGCGKTLTALAVLRLLPAAAQLLSGEIRLHGTSITTASDREMDRIRGRRIAMLPQDPFGTLNPVFSVGHQIAAAVRLNQSVSRNEARQQAEELLAQCGLPNPAEVMRSYPHQLSGGMQQRAGLAFSLSGSPDVLIADEPTTALDAKLQVQIAAALRNVQRLRSMALLLITHDLGLVNLLADRVVVMYAGRVVESGAREDVMERPCHPYTRGLLDGLKAERSADGYLRVIPGAISPVREWGEGCRFAPRCELASPACLDARPLPVECGAGHVAMCLAAPPAGGQHP